METPSPEQENQEPSLGQGTPNPGDQTKPSPKKGFIDTTLRAAQAGQKNTVNDARDIGNALKSAGRIAKDWVKKAVKKTIIRVGTWLVATFGWWLIPIGIGLIILVVAAILIFSSLTCSGGRCQPDTPTGTKDDKKQTAKIEALANPKNTTYAAMISNDIRKEAEDSKAKLETRKNSTDSQAEKDAIDKQISIVNEILASLDQLILSQSSSSNTASIKNIFDSIASAFAKLIYATNGGIVSKADDIDVSLPLNPNDINGFGKDIHGFSELNHNEVSNHNVYKSIYNQAFGDQGRYADAADISAPAGSSVYAPLTGTAFVFDRGGEKERLEIITDDNNSSVLLAHIKIDSSDSRFTVKAGDKIGSISDKTSKSQLHCQLTLKNSRYVRTQTDAGDGELWVRMELALSGNPPDATAGTEELEAFIQELKNIIR